MGAEAAEALSVGLVTGLVFFLCDAWLWGGRWVGVHDVTLWVEFVRGWAG